MGVLRIGRTVVHTLVGTVIGRSNSSNLLLEVLNQLEELSIHFCVCIHFSGSSLTASTGGASFWYFMLGHELL